ncbi:MAG: hypothetical protein MI741_07970, partial [Rhodospirillales bacterium]|nr:hypothetical protein [Rhodospirillales bacterium]
MPTRIVILSDLHMGRSRGSVRSAEAVRLLWQGASHLVINGDLAELHHPEYRAEAAKQSIRLFELCEQDNVGLTLLSGNHDAQISDVRHLLLSQGRVLITHGDVLHPAIIPWSVNAKLLRQTFANARKSLASET